MISFLFADWLVNIPDALGTNQQERVWSKWGQIITEIQNRYSAFLWRIFPVRAKIQTPKSKNKMLFIREFCGFTFSHRKPFKKIRALVIRIRHFLKNAWSVSNICSNVANFPAKRLRRPKYACANFFFPKIVIFQSTLPMKWTFSLVLSSTFSQKYSFYCLSLYILYSVNH